MDNKPDYKDFSNERLTEILESISDAFFSLDKELRVIYFNAAAEKMLGRKREEVLGKKLFDSFPQAKGSVFELNYTKAVKEQIRIDFETYFDVPPYINWYNVAVYPTGKGISVYFQIITEKKQHKEQLKNTNEELIELNKKLAKQNKEYLALNEEYAAQNEELKTNLDEIHQLTDKAKETKDFYENVIEGVPDGIWISDRNDVIIYANKAMEKIAGVSKEQIRGSNVLKDFPEETTNFFNNYYLKAKNTLQPQWYEVQVTTPSGKKTWQNGWISPQINKGIFDGAITTIRDATEEKLAKEKLKQGEEKFRALYENAPQSYQSLDENGCFIDINPTWLKTLGYERDEVIGKCYADFLHPDWVAHFQKNFPEFKRRGYVHDVQFRLRHKKGHFIDVSFEGCAGYHPDGSFKQTYCVFKDITEQKKVEQKLYESEENYRLLVENQTDLIVKVNTDGRFEYVSDSYCKLFGKKREELIGKNFMPLVHEEDRESTAKAMEFLYNEPYCAYIEQRAMTKEGWCWLGWMDTAVLDKDGKVVSIIGAGRDITQRKKIELDLIKAKETAEENQMKYSHLVNNIYDLVCEIDEQGIYTYLSERYIDVLGYHPNELLGEPAIGLIHPDDLQKSLEKYDEVQDTEDTSINTWRFKHKNGEYRYFECKSKGYKNLRGKKRTVVISQDVTERNEFTEALQQREEQLKEAQKVAQIGSWSYNVVTQKPVWTEQMFELFGIGAKNVEPTYEDHKKYIHPEDWDKFDTSVSNTIKTGEGYDIEIRINQPKGKTIWVNAKCRTIKQNGEVVELIGTTQNISKKKEIEQKLIEAKEIAEGKEWLVRQHNNRLKILLELGQMRNSGLKEIYDFTLEKAIELCDSKIGFLGFLNEEETVVSIYSWSNSAMKECQVDAVTTDFVVEKCGIWSESIKKRQAYIINDYNADNPLKKGLPKGHVPLKNYLSVPVFDNEKIVAVIAIANKEADYNETDQKELMLLMNGMWGIVKQHKVEEELQKSYDLLHNLTAQVPGVVYQYRLYPDGRSAFPFSTKQMYDIYEVTSEEVREDASPVFTRIHPDDYDYIVESITESAQNQTIYSSEFRVILPKQGLRWRHCDARPQKLEDGSTLWYGIITDITELKKTKDEAKENEVRLKRLVENMNAGVAVYKAINNGKDFRFIDFNKAAEKITCEKKENVLGKTLLERFPQMDKAPLFKALQQVYITGRDLHLPPFYYKDQKRDGWRENYIYKLPTDEIVAIFDDVTKREEYQKALIESEEKFRTIFEMAGDMVCTADVKTATFIDVNPAFTRILGYSKEELISRPFLDFIHPDDVQRTLDVIDRELLKGTTIISFINRYKCKNGSYRWLDWNSQPVPEKDITYAIAHDITEIKNYQEELEKHRNHLEELVSERTAQLEKTLDNLKEAEAQLVQSEKMASLGILTAGVAHEINNPLNYIQSGIYGLRKLIEKGCDEATFNNKTNEIINIMQEGVKKASKIVKGLNTFSRKSGGEKKECDIHKIIENCLLLLNNELKNKCTVFKKYEFEKFSIKGDEENLHQVFINLILNSAQAIKTEGEIIISTELLKADQLVQITISDNGKGISEDDLKKIFDPFFTTKEPGEGTGLGLSIVYKIIKDHKGTIRYESKLSKGTDVILSFPII